MTSSDDKRRVLTALSRELRWRPLTRRRLVNELSQHLDDSAADLQQAGLEPDQALREAVRRLGDVEAIAGSVRSVGPAGRWGRRARRLRSPAWVAAGAMSLVTAWAAELPPASGAKATTSALPRTTKHVGRFSHPPSDRTGHARGSTRSLHGRRP